MPSETKVISARLPIELVKQLEDLARLREMSPGILFAAILTDYLTGELREEMATNFTKMMSAFIEMQVAIAKETEAKVENLAADVKFVREQLKEHLVVE